MISNPKIVNVYLLTKYILLKNVAMFVLLVLLPLQHA